MSRVATAQAYRASRLARATATLLCPRRAEVASAQARTASGSRCWWAAANTARGPPEEVPPDFPFGTQKPVGGEAQGTTMDDDGKTFEERYARLPLRDVQAIAEASETEYRPSAIAAARAVLARRLDRADPDEADLPRQALTQVAAGGKTSLGRLRTAGSILLIGLGGTLLIPAVFNASALLLDWSLRDTLVAFVGLALGASLTFAGYKSDPSFWSHAPKVYGMMGFAEGAAAIARLATGSYSDLEVQLGHGLNGLALFVAGTVLFFVARRRAGAAFQRDDLSPFPASVHLGCETEEVPPDCPR